MKSLLVHCSSLRGCQAWTDKHACGAGSRSCSGRMQGGPVWAGHQRKDVSTLPSARPSPDPILISSTSQPLQPAIAQQDRLSVLRQRRARDKLATVCCRPPSSDIRSMRGTPAFRSGMATLHMEMRFPGLTPSSSAPALTCQRTNRSRICFLCGAACYLTPAGPRCL